MTCEYRPLKDEKYRALINVGGDILICPDDAGSSEDNLLETNILINSTISDAIKGAKFMCMDTKDHFLSMPMSNSEHIKVKIKHKPNDIRSKYGINNLTIDNR